MTGGTPDLDRLREALARADEGARAAAECPAPEQIWAAVSGQAAPEAARKLMQHGATCPACGTAWRLAADLLHASAAGSARRGYAWSWAAAQAAAGSARRGYAWSWAAAAAILLLGAVALMLPPREATHDVTFRSRPGEAGIDSLVPDMVGLARTGVLLRWTAPPGAARYRVTVATPELVTVHVSGWLSQPELVVPDASLKNLPSGQVLVWTVEAVLDDGRQISSRAFLVQLE